LDCRFINWLSEDSNNISKQNIKDLAKLIKDLRKEGIKKILITCGTDRMAHLARDLKDLLKGLGVVVAFAGAITPISHGTESDGPANLKTGMAFLEKADPDICPGVYVAMNKGKDIFIAGKNLRKDINTGIFYGTKMPDAAMNKEFRLSGFN